MFFNVFLKLDFKVGWAVSFFDCDFILFFLGFGRYSWKMSGYKIIFIFMSRKEVV